MKKCNGCVHIGTRHPELIPSRDFIPQTRCLHCIRQIRKKGTGLSNDFRSDNFQNKKDVIITKATRRAFGEKCKDTSVGHWGLAHDVTFTKKGQKLTKIPIIKTKLKQRCFHEK
jgi:hypothetical protein